MDKIPLSIFLGSGVVAAIVSGLIGWLMKSVDFKFDYKKYILKKRIDAYEAANIYFNKFYRVGTLGSGKNYNKILVPNDSVLPKDKSLLQDELKKYYNNLNEELLNVLNNRIWFSKVFYNQVCVLVNLIASVLLEIEKNNYEFYQVSEIVTKEYEEITNIVEKLDKIYISDISKLGDIKTFIKEML